MAGQRLYLFIGAPGAGKTHVAKALAAKTGAIHIWADIERQRLFGQPTHSQTESDELYARLNDEASLLLKQGKSVIFDTNFNFYADRLKLRSLADQSGAETIVVWVTTPEAIARSRSVYPPTMRNGYLQGMTDEQFNAITSKLEPPHEDEKVIKIDGRTIDDAAIQRVLQEV